MYERICTGDPEKHTFLTEGADDERLCPECQAPAKSGFAIAVPHEPFANITSGREEWALAIGSFVSFMQLFHFIAIANWFEAYFVAAAEAAVATAVCRWLRNLRPLHWYQHKVIPGFERLRVDMSIDDLARAAQEMASISAEIEGNEAEKREALAEFKAVDEQLHKRLNTVSARVREGNYQNVAVDTIHDLQLGSATRVRRDTGEIISERPLDENERQAVLDFNGAGEKPATADTGKKKLRAVNGHGKAKQSAKPDKPKKPPKKPKGSGDEARPH